MRRGRENRVGNRFQSVTLNECVLFRRVGQTFQVQAPSGLWAQQSLWNLRAKWSPFPPRCTCSLIPQPLKWRKKEEMWAGPLVGRDGKNRGKNELELGRKRFFPSGSCFLVCKTGVGCQCIFSGAGWEKQLLGTGVVMGDGISSAWILCAVCRRDWQNMLQNYAGSLHFLPWGKN